MAGVPVPYEKLQRNLEDMQTKMDILIVETKKVLNDQKAKDSNMQQGAYFKNETLTRPSAPSRDEIEIAVPNNFQKELLHPPNKTRGAASKGKDPMNKRIFCQFCRILIIHLVFAITLAIKICLLLNPVDFDPEHCSLSAIILEKPRQPRDGHSRDETRSDIEKTQRNCLRNFLANLFFVSIEEILFAVSFFVLAKFYGLLISFRVFKELQNFALLKKKAWEQNVQPADKCVILAKSYLFAFVKCFLLLIWTFFLAYVLMCFTMASLIWVGFFVMILCFILFSLLSLPQRMVGY